MASTDCNAEDAGAQEQEKEEDEEFAKLLEDDLFPEDGDEDSDTETKVEQRPSHLENLEERSETLPEEHSGSTDPRRPANKVIIHEGFLVVHLLVT